MDLSLKLLLYQSINFIVLMVILGFLFNKYLRPFMQKRSNDIKAAFTEIDAQKKEIEKLKENILEQTKEMRCKVKEEIEKAIAEGNHIRDNIVAQAEKESAVRIDKAKQEIEHEKEKVIMEIQKEIASLSLLAARQLIKKQMDDSTNRRLVEDFLEELTKNPPKKS